MSKSNIDDKELERLAVEELLREACRGAVRAEVQGPSGWLKCPLPTTNKRFLKNTVKNIVASNNFHQRKIAEKRSISPEKESSNETRINNDKTKSYKKKRL